MINLAVTPGQPRNSTTNWNALADRVIAGEVLDEDSALSILRSPDDELLDLLAASYRIRRQHFGNR
ncbi:MAG TPA: biotin synthase BioB, partial [Pirellulales bacterium]